MGDGPDYISSSITKAADAGQVAPGNTSSGTRVFKKSSPSNHLTVYLGRRDFIHYAEEKSESSTCIAGHIDPIDGVVLVDKDYVTLESRRKVYVQVLAAFRYGREDLDVLGLTFRKDLFFSKQLLYPKSEDTSHTNGSSSNEVSSLSTTRLQDRLMRKLASTPASNGASSNGTPGSSTANTVAIPFTFNLSPNSPASVTLQPSPSDAGKPCGVDYELKAFIAEPSGAESLEGLEEQPGFGGATPASSAPASNNGTPNDKAHKKNIVRLAIRKLTYAPCGPGAQPSKEASKVLHLGGKGHVRLEASLDKQKFYHGETLHVNVLIDNNTNRVIKRVKVSCRQLAEICLFSSAEYSCPVDSVECDTAISASTTGWCKIFSLTPLLARNRDKRGLALDGKLKHEDTNLASSTLLTKDVRKETLGVVVSYRVKVKLTLGFGAGDLFLELPFILTHPKPVAPSTASSGGEKNEGGKASSSTKPSVVPENIYSDDVTGLAAAGSSKVNEEDRNTPVELDLINFDDEDEDDDNPHPTTSSSTAPVGLPQLLQHQSSSVDDTDLVFEEFARLRAAQHSTFAQSTGATPGSSGGAQPTPQTSFATPFS